jgi:hypothetical protein
MAYRGWFAGEPVSGWPVQKEFSIMEIGNRANGHNEKTVSGIVL